jgi:hypothetical protein
VTAGVVGNNERDDAGALNSTGVVVVGGSASAGRCCAACALRVVADRIAGLPLVDIDALRISVVPAGPSAICFGCGRPIMGEPRSAASLLAAALAAARAAPAGTPCPRCGAELPPGRRRYCSQRCQQAAATQRYRARRHLGG